MSKLLACGTLAIVIGLGAAEANAKNVNPDVSSWSSYTATVHSPERFTLHNPEGPLNDYYRYSGLSDRREDCASYGCSVAN